MSDNLSKNVIRRSLFRNIMVYSIVAAIITVVFLLTLMSFPPSRQFATSIITAEVVLFIILFWALIAMNMYMNDMFSKMNGRNESIMHVDRCPDFFTAERNSDGEVVCRNGIDLPDTGYQFRYVSTSNRNVPSNVPLDTVNGKKYKEACAVANPGLRRNQMYNIPWTSVRPRCTSGEIDGATVEGSEEDCDTKYGFVYDGDE